MTVKDVVNEFNTIPFLFVGSGISRRYLGLPDWRGLLEHFAHEIKDEEFIFNAYEAKAKDYPCEYGELPKVAELIQKDYDQKWFVDDSIRHAGPDGLQMIKSGVSPFKVEIAAYLGKTAEVQKKYSEEIQILHLASEKCIAGVITTNYDTFLEDHLSDFTKYVGQSQLIFAPIQGIAEIYKIHGSIEQPDSIIITEQDYQGFDQNSSYLIAKLMTLFMEFPMIFIGYSISDPNVQKIITGMVKCLDDEQLDILQNRFIFVEYQKDHFGADVSPYTIMVEGRPLNLKKIVMDDFGLLYGELKAKQSKLSVRLLRRFKQELYDFTITNEPTGNLRVAALEDQRVTDDELVLAIGTAQTLGLHGLSGISGNEWYRNVVMDDLKFSNEQLLQYALPDIVKQFTRRIPIHKYLVGVSEIPTEAQKIADDTNFESIISSSIKKNRRQLKGYTSIAQIWNTEKQDRKKAYRLMSYLTEDQIDINELEKILKGAFEDSYDVLDNAVQEEKTNLRRLIRIYDYLKWGKTKEPSN